MELKQKWGIFHIIKILFVLYGVFKNFFFFCILGNSDNFMQLFLTFHVMSILPFLGFL